MRSAPIPFQAALQNHAGTAARQIESDTEIDFENAGDLPVAAAEKLVHFGLGARPDGDARDLSVVLQRRREFLPLPPEQHGRFEVPAVGDARSVEGALENRVEDDLPALELTVNDRPQF